MAYQSFKRKIAKNSNAKYKVTYTKYSYKRTTSTGSETKYSYSKQISNSSNLSYKEQ
jgi:hypothetical protein